MHVKRFRECERSESCNILIREIRSQREAFRHARPYVCSSRPVEIRIALHDSKEELQYPRVRLMVNRRCKESVTLNGQTMLLSAMSTKSSFWPDTGVSSSCSNFCDFDSLTCAYLAFGRLISFFAHEVKGTQTSCFWVAADVVELAHLATCLLLMVRTFSKYAYTD